MSLQTIINLAESISINRRKTIGIQYTRSQIVKSTEMVTRNPWRFTVKVSAVIPYEDARQITEEIDRLDRANPEEISFSDNPKLSWMFKYQGSMTAPQMSALRVLSFTNNSLVLDHLSDITLGTLMFRAGDIIQIAGLPYPFTVVYDVYKSSGGTVTLTTHRPSFFNEDIDPVIGESILIGNSVNFNVLCVNMPTYTLVPGGQTALLQFDSEFQLYEYTRTVL